MASTTDKQIILYGVPVCWVFDLDVATPDGIIDLWQFDNLGVNPTYKIMAGGSSSSGGENIDITRADGGIIRFTKTIPIIKGEDDTKAVESSGGTSASGFGEMTIVINESYIGASSWTAFIKAVQAKKANSAKFLIVFPTGYTHARKGAMGIGIIPDGYVYMIGSISNDIEQQIQAGAATTLTLTFAAKVANDWFDAPDNTSPTVSFTGKGIPIKRGGSTIPATNNVPVDLIAADITDLQAGKIILKEVA